MTHISRRRAIGLIGLGTLATQFPFSCSGEQSRLTDLEKQSIHYLTLTEVAELIQSKKISSEELTQIMLDRIAALDGKLNSYITVMSKDALAKARELDRELALGKYRGPLHGVPIGIKDLLYTTNAPTTASHSFKSNFIPTYNGTVVEKLQHAGAVILGKLNLTEGAMGGYNATSKIPINPWGADLWTGVSSSGSGVATSAGLCFGSIGSDTGGSIRFPCMANGIVGLKPTYGLVSRYGVLPLAESLDHIGPMTRSTLDAAVMLEAIAGHDPHDSTSLAGDSINITSTIKDGIEGLRIGIDHDYASKGVAPALVSAIEDALQNMKDMGATIVPFKMPGNVEKRSNQWFVIASREAFLANQETYPSRKAEYGNGFAEILETGIQVTDQQYQQALQYCQEFRTEFRKLLSEVDALVAPAGGMAKGITDKMWRAGGDESAIAIFNDDLDLHFGAPADMAGIPALTLPCGKASDGMPPPGFQLMGGPLTEAMLVRIGYAYEQATDWHNQHPKI